MLVVIWLAAIVAIVCGQDTLGDNTNVNNFDSVDIDKDGSISRPEFQKWARTTLHMTDAVKILELFSTYDTNGDSSLTVPEFVPLAYHLSQKMVISGDTVFSRLDRNRDGVVDKNEQSAAGVDGVVLAGIISVADANGDGILTRQEFEAAISDKKENKAISNREEALDLITDADQNGDRKISLSEIKHFASKFGKVPEKEITEAFHLLDADHDQQLTLNELQKFPTKITQPFKQQAPPVVR